MISVADLQAYLGAPEDGAESEALLESIEERMVALIESETGRYFGASSSVTWLLSGYGGNVLYLPDYVTAVASVNYRGYLYEDFTELPTTTGWALYGSQVLRVDGGEWPVGDALIEVTATRGYAAGEEPKPIRQLVMDAVNFYYRAGRKLFLESGGAPDPGNVVPGWERIVNLYKAPLYG